MPTVRFELRSEYRLGNPELYRAAERKDDDPEALLEGVAMAGLVGILRQLGDLAEFAAEIFHDLHREVTATASRGHRLMLRVQQVEAEFPAFEKAFLRQSSQTRFASNTGINWHSKLSMDHNLIIKERLPHFMMDSYEECRGPPQLSMLDKFDVSGAGACLKRYSDPSFFKAQLASSCIMESQVKQGKIVHKNEKGKYWRNGDAPVISSMQQINSKLEFMTFNQTTEDLPATHTRLKSWRLNGSETTSYMELLHQVLLPEENYSSRSQNIYSDIKESIAVSADREKDSSQSPMMNGKCGMVRPRLKVKELPETPSEHEESAEDSSDDYLPSELQNSSSMGLQEPNQKEFSSDGDWRTEDTAGGNSSGDLASDVESYMDALNTMESEVETDSENNLKPKLGFSPNTGGVNSGTDDEHVLQTNSRSHQKSNSVRSISSCKSNSVRSVSSSAHSYTSSDRSDVQKPHRDRITLDLPANQDSYLVESDYENIKELRNCEAELISLENFLSAGNSNAKETTTSALNEYSRKFPSKSTYTDSTSSNYLPSNGGPDDNLSASRNLDDKHSDISGRQDGKLLEDPNRSIEDSPTLPEGTNDVILDQSDNEIKEISVPLITTGTAEVCTRPCTPLHSPVEAQVVSASVISDYELGNLASSDLSDTNLSDDGCHTVPFEYAQKDIHPTSIENDCIDPYGGDRNFGFDTLSCDHPESTREENVSSPHILREVVEPSEETSATESESTPDIISFERYLSLNKDHNQVNPSDAKWKSSDSARELDSHVTSGNVSFTEFLKLTQMDWLLNVDPLQNESGFDSKVAPHISQNVKDDLSMSPHIVSETANTVERLQVSSGSNMIPSLHGDVLPMPSDFLLAGQHMEQEIYAGNPIDAVDNKIHLKSEAETHVSNSRDMDGNLYNTSEYEQHLHDLSVPYPSGSHVQASFLPSNFSNNEVLMPPEKPSEQSSESCEPESISPFIDNAVEETMENLPPLPPLPPLEWTTGKNQMGLLTSSSTMPLSSSGRTLLSAPSAIDDMTAHGLPTERDRIVQKSNEFTPFLLSKEEMPHCGSLLLEWDSVQSVNLSHMCQSQSEILLVEDPKTHPSGISFSHSTIEDNNHLDGIQAFGMETAHPLDSLSSENSFANSLSVPIPPFENEISQLDQISSGSKLKKSRLQQSLEEMEGPVTHFCMELIPQADCYHVGDTLLEDNTDSPAILMLETEKPKKKLYMRDGLKDPLIEDVASHDKSTLRNVCESLQASTKPVKDESVAFLEQIRNKSHNLKPTASCVKPNLRAPPTNLKIAAILEKANAIRQACVGSDEEDDDEDNWSDG